MNRIETEIREQTPENPRMMKYIGQRTAQEVFAELKHRLESTGYLPDEYFLLDSHWENGMEIPKDSYITCRTDYGSSEGIYLDIYLEWYDAEQKQEITANFATGKTLGETALDLDRMNLIASAVTQAFHADGVHARYIRLGEPEQPSGCVMHLNGAERRLLIDSLTYRHGQLAEETQAVERLLRRITGSITEYINEVGQRPANLSSFDEAVLAAHDGNLPVFSDAYRKTPDKIDELLIYAAGRPGKIGRQMTEMICVNETNITKDNYEFIVDITPEDWNRVQNSAVLHLPATQAEFICALDRAGVNGSDFIVEVQDGEYIRSRDFTGGAAVNYEPADGLLGGDEDYIINFNALTSLSVNCAGDYIKIIYLDTLCFNMDSHTQNYGILRNADSGETLGMDFDLYAEWTANDRYAVKSRETYDAVRDYWENKIMEMTDSEQNNGQIMGGM